MRALLLARGLPVGVDDDVPCEAVLEAIARDKKRVGASVPFVLVSAPGDVALRLRGRAADDLARRSRSSRDERAQP